MITIPLHISRSSAVQRQAEAWLLPGEDSAVWLRAIARWSVTHADVRIFVLPASGSSRATDGALVTAGDEHATRSGPPGAIPYGRAAGRLYVPIDAVFEPAVAETELSGLLADERTHVWRPHVGLVGFEPSDALTIADLVAVAPRNECDWRRATPGVTLAGRLLALAAAHAPTVQEVLKEAQEDISSETSPLSELPPAPGEPRASIVTKVLPWLVLPFALLGAAVVQLIAWLTSLVPATGTRRTWINSLEDWARQKMQRRPKAALTPGQQRELNRLLHMLDSDPDRGLRFALPLFAPSPRGVDAASGRLAEHATDFNLSNLAGGRRAAAWEASAEVQAQLARRYRELANREIALGRHRRATYIFAELLHDMSAAARTLTDGGHWREAAVLYRDRLNNNHEAARCLEQAGQYTEAIELLESMKRYEQAGDLYQKIGQPEEAAGAYRRQVAAHLNVDNHIAAAALLETKLESPDEALAALDEAWPDGKNALDCLDASFRLLARTGRGAEATPRLEALRITKMPPHVRHRLHGALADLANGFPDDKVRSKAADVSRVLVADQWEDLSPQQRREVTGWLARLASEDRLLRRDCVRMADDVSPAPIPLPRPASKSSLRNVTLVRQMELAAGTNWQSAVASAEGIFVAYPAGNRRIGLLRVDWLGEEKQCSMSWTAESNLTRAPLVMAIDGLTGRHVLVHAMFSDPLPPRTVPNSAAGGVAITAGSIPGVTRDLIGAAFTAQGLACLLDHRPEGVVAHVTSSHGNLVGSRILQSVVPAFPIHMHARRDSLYLTSEGTLILCHAEDGSREIRVELDSPIRSLAGVAQHARLRIAVGLETGAAIWWDSISVDAPTYIARDLQATLVEFNLAGQLIVVGESAAEIYATSQGRAELIGKCSGWEGRPIAVLRSPIANEFAIVAPDGVISIYRVD